MSIPRIQFDRGGLRLDDIVYLAERSATAELDPSPEFVCFINRGAEFLKQLLEDDGVIYGVTTGYGNDCTVPVPRSLVSELPKQLYTFHGVGLGQLLGEKETRAVLAVRLATLCKGHSGVRFTLIKQLEQLMKHDILPAIPEEGSVGASGDLTPLSYVAAVLCGEREVLTKNGIEPAKDALARAGLAPITLCPKEALAVMNGTAVMSALACLAYARAEYLSRLSTRITSMVVSAMAGNTAHYSEGLFTVKPHPGQQRIAARIRRDLGDSAPPARNSDRVQDRYSLRCSPHIIGVLEDALPFFRQLIENEINGTTDNPIIDAEAQQVLHGGHFYGGHIAFAMDGMKQLVANLADLLDRQVIQLMDTRFNHGLPANLSGASAERASINHGLKALGIGTSAWAAEALKLTMPASVFSRSTEGHNQDKVSMGTIAARDCLRVLTLTEQVAAASLLTAAQGMELRQRVSGKSAPTELEAMLAEVRKESSFLAEDRRLDIELRGLCASLGNRAWNLYPEERT